MNKLYVILLLSIIMIFTGAGVSLSSDVSVQLQIEAGTVKTPVYEAVVEKDGCLTSLKVNGDEFLAADVSISRGSYFYQDGALALPEISTPGNNMIMAQGDKAAVKYEFGSNTMTWTVTNKTEAPMFFFMVLNKNMEIGIGENNVTMKLPVARDWNKVSFISAKSRVEISGSTKLWGPWNGGYQVWDASLAGGETREIKLKMNKPSQKELEKMKEINKPVWKNDKDLNLMSPKNYQVFQRRTKTKGHLIISGRVNLPCDKLEYRLTGISLTGNLGGDWQPLPLMDGQGRFSMVALTKAGGWYKFEIKALKDGKEVVSETVQKVGVGEIFVGAGQSNSTNCGQFPIKQSSGMVSSFSGEFWQLADDPQPGAADNSTGGSFWPAFGDLMYEKYNVPIGVAVTGYGGTSVKQWQPDGDLHKWMMTRILKLGPSGFRAVLWHQGESDAFQEYTEYFEMMSNVIEASTYNAGWEFPWFVAQATYHNVDKLSDPLIRDAQKKLWDEGVALEGPDTDTLTGDNRDLDGAGIHFSPKGLRAHGKMWFEKVSTYLDEVLD